MLETGERLRVYPQLKVNGGNVYDHTQLRHITFIPNTIERKKNKNVRDIRRRELWEVGDTQLQHTWIEPTHHSKIRIILNENHVADMAALYKIIRKSNSTWNCCVFLSNTFG